MRARLLLVAAALIAFGASLGSGFHFDDYYIFSGHPLEIWSVRQTRPLTMVSFWLNGRSPIALHAFNLLLHVAAVLLAFECFRRLIPRRSALVAAAIFAVHPLQAEAVDYIWGRSIVLAAVFCFASLLCWLDGHRWPAVACFAAALLAKEESAAFPIVIFLFDRKRGRLQIAVMLALSLAAGLRVIYATAVIPGAPAGVQAGITPWHYFLAQGVVVWRYLRLLIIPFGFSVDPQVAIPPAILGFAGWAALLGGAVAAARTRLGVWPLAGVVLLLPSSSIFPAADLAADRRMYLPLFAFAAAVALVIDGFRWRWAVVAAFAALAAARTYVWMSDERLWREAVEAAPQKVRPKIQLSRSVAPAEALALLADARRLAPEDPAVASETGRVLLASGRAAEALAEFGRALALAPRDANSYNNRGVALAALGQTAAARLDFERALQLDPSLESARENLRKVR